MLRSALAFGQSSAIPWGVEGYDETYTSYGTGSPFDPAGRREPSWTFTPDGLTLYAGSDGVRDLYKTTCSTPFVPDGTPTVVESNTFSTSENIRGMSFCDSGNKVVFYDFNQTISVYSLSVPYQLESTRTLFSSTDIFTINRGQGKPVFSPDGRTLIIQSWTDIDRSWSYHLLSTPFLLSSITTSFDNGGTVKWYDHLSGTTGSYDGDQDQPWFSPDGTKVYLSLRGASYSDIYSWDVDTAGASLGSVSNQTLISSTGLIYNSFMGGVTEYYQAYNGTRKLIVQDENIAFLVFGML